VSLKYIMKNKSNIKKLTTVLYIKIFARLHLVKYIQ